MTLLTERGIVMLLFLFSVRVSMAGVIEVVGLKYV
jgi:hypothetical protein